MINFICKICEYQASNHYKAYCSNCGKYGIFAGMESLLVPPFVLDFKKDDQVIHIYIKYEFGEWKYIISFPVKDFSPVVAKDWLERLEIGLVFW